MFFQQVQQYAAPYTRSQALKASRDPLQNAKHKFRKVASDQLQLLKNNSSKGFWFVQLPNKQYIITLKNGAKKLNPDTPDFVVSDQSQAIQFLQQAIQALDNNEFDDLLIASSRKPRKQQQEDESPKQEAKPIAKSRK